MLVYRILSCFFVTVVLLERVIAGVQTVSANENIGSKDIGHNSNNDDEESVPSFAEIFSSAEGGDCGGCITDLGIDGSCSIDDPLKYLDAFVNAHESCITNCKAVIDQLHPMCCPSPQAGLESHCNIFFGSTGCSSFLQEEAVVHEGSSAKKVASVEKDSSFGFNFIQLAEALKIKETETIAVSDSPPPANCMTNCGCNSSGSCSGASFDSLTCCNIADFVSNQCLNCVTCETDPSQCNIFSTSTPTQGPDTGGTTSSYDTGGTTSSYDTGGTTSSAANPSYPGTPRLMSDFLTKDELCDIFGVQRWWYPTGGKQYDPQGCSKTNYTECMPPGSYWGSYGPEGRYLDFWDSSGFSGTTTWTRTSDREECIKAVTILLDDVDNAITLLRQKDATKFNELFNNGNDGIDRLEVAAFWAHVTTETGGLSDFFESVSDSSQASNYGNYYGRGPLQLSYEANYQAFSDFLGDPSIMSNPDQLIDDPVIMWASGFWFWMYDTTFDVWSNDGAIGVCPIAHKGSMHWAITKGPGFGLSIAMLNGAVECNPNNVQGGQKRWEKMNSRVRYLLWDMHIMRLAAPTTPNLIIDKKAESEFWSAPYVAIPDYFTEGCPPIHEGPDKLKCKGQLQKFGYDSTRYGRDDLKKGPFYAGWNGGGESFDTNMGWETYFDAPFPWVSSADAVGYVQVWQDCQGESETVYSGGHYTCTENICSADPMEHLWILKSIMRYQCDNKPTGGSVPSSCPTGSSESWPEGKWRTDSNEWPNSYLQGKFQASDDNYLDDEYEAGSGSGSGGGSIGGTSGTGSAMNPRPESDFANRQKVSDILTQDNICDMFSATRWYYPNGNVNSQVCEMCGPRSVYPPHTPPLRIDDVFIANQICPSAQVPNTPPFEEIVDLWNACRVSADNTLRSTGNVQSEWGSYSAEGQYVYQYGRLQGGREPWASQGVSNILDTFTFIEQHWNRTKDREICRNTAIYVLEDLDAALVEVRKRNSRFDSLFDNGNRMLDKIELAGFLAHVNKETGSMSEWLESVDSQETATYKNGNIMCDPNSEYTCVTDAWYSGKGPLQLTWNINIGKFDRFWNGQEGEFLKDPEMLVKDSIIGWGAAYWFWMEINTFDVWSHTMGGDVCPFPHQGSMHDAMTRSVGFGLSIAIINGQIECSPYDGDYQRMSMPLARLRYFVFNLWILNVPIPQEIMYDKDDFYNGDFVAMPKYFHEGCPLIGMDSKKENRACIPRCKAMLQRLGFYNDEPMCAKEFQPGDELKGCPDCTTSDMVDGQLYGAVMCGYNLNDPVSYQFSLPWPAVGSLEALNYSPEGYAYCQLQTGTYNGLEYFFPRYFQTDCRLQDSMCIYAKDGTTRVGIYTGTIQDGNVVTGINIQDCPPGPDYCCHSNSHTTLMKYSSHSYSEYVLWRPDPILRFQCDHCTEDCDGQPCPDPESFGCPTGKCADFSAVWPDGAWVTNPEEWPNYVLNQ